MSHDSPEFDAALAATVAEHEKADGIKPLVAASRQAAVFQHRAEVAEAALARVAAVCDSIDPPFSPAQGFGYDEMASAIAADIRAALEATS